MSTIQYLFIYQGINSGSRWSVISGVKWSWSTAFPITGLKDYTNIAMPYSTEVPENGKIKLLNHYENKINGAAGGILSNVDDMSKWMILQLNKGKYGDKSEKFLFTEERQKEMWRIHTVTDANPNPRYNSHFAGYGLGWGLNDINGNLWVSHEGGLPGMLSIVSLIPDMKLGIVILTNTEMGGAGLYSAVNNAILSSYLGLAKIDFIEFYAKRLESLNSNADSVVANAWKQVEMAKNVKIMHQDFIGIYEDNWFGKIEVFLKGDQLWLKSYRSPKLNGPMSYYKANTFAIKWEYQDLPCDAFAIFSLDEEGKAQNIKIKGISPIIDFSFDFQDLDLQRVKE